MEIIVRDGGGTDDSVAILERYSDWLSFWQSQPDSGQSDTINQGLSRATGEWLTWLNSDEVLLPGALEVLRNNIDRHPDIDWWTGSGWFIDEKGRRLNHYDAPERPLNAQDLSPWTRPLSVTYI